MLETPKHKARLSTLHKVKLMHKQRFLAATCGLFWLRQPPVSYRHEGVGTTFCSGRLVRPPGRGTRPQAGPAPAAGHAVSARVTRAPRGATRRVTQLGHSAGTATPSTFNCSSASVPVHLPCIPLAEPLWFLTVCVSPCLCVDLY